MFAGLLRDFHLCIVILGARHIGCKHLQSHGCVTGLPTFKLHRRALDAVELAVSRRKKES